MRCVGRSRTYDLVRLASDGRHVGVWWGRWTNTSPKETAEDFEELVGFVNSNQLEIEPKNIYTLDEASKALSNFLQRKNIGKTVIKF